MLKGMDLGPEYVIGLPLVSRGKVRDTYDLGDGLLLVVASDRISIFDFVLNAVVALKGEVLTAMNIFWKTHVLADFDSDLVAFGADIDGFLPTHLQGNPSLQKRAVVVKKLKMFPVEAIVRGYLTGSGLKAYQDTDPHTVCGHVLPAGLHDGSILPKPIFTPTTKATEGHDEHISAQSVEDVYGSELSRRSLSLYEVAHLYAKQRGITIADTKFEFGQDEHGRLRLGDEALTPDSSRFWDVTEWKEASLRSQSPQSHDKQFVREWGKNFRIHQRDPQDQDGDYPWVRGLVVPSEILDQTTAIYLNIFQRLVGKSLQDFQRENMGITA